MREIYEHKVQYYETDKMGITHHSNYIRWMEEARVDFLEKAGWPFDKLEEMGIVSPVVSTACRYKIPTRFADTVRILVTADPFKGVKLKLRYIMTNAEGKTVCEAESEHCFLNREGFPVRLRKEFPAFYNALISLAEESSCSRK